MGLIPQFQNTVLLFIFVALIVATLVALVDATSRRAEVFEAAGKLTKKGWVLILALCLGMEYFLPGIGQFVGAVATIVYFVDVRPAVSALSKRR